MVIKCSFLVSLQNLRDNAKNFTDSQPLPEYIVETGPYVNNKKGGIHQIIILYKFDKARFAEAWEDISKKLDSLRTLPGFTVSAHIYGPRPYHLPLEKGDEIKKYLDLDFMIAPPPVSMTS